MDFWGMIYLTALRTGENLRIRGFAKFKSLWRIYHNPEIALALDAFL